MRYRKYCIHDRSFDSEFTNDIIDNTVLNLSLTPVFEIKAIHRKRKTHFEIRYYHTMDRSRSSLTLLH